MARKRKSADGESKQRHKQKTDSGAVWWRIAGLLRDR
jgi:hypothetical protein